MTVSTAGSFNRRVHNQGENRTYARKCAVRQKQASVPTFHLEVDATRVAHERLPQGDAAFLAPDDAALEHQPVLVDLRSTQDAR